MRFWKLIPVVCCMLVACNDTAIATPEPTATPIRFTGLFLVSDIESYNLDADSNVIHELDDIPNERIITQQDDDVIFNCDITEYTSIGSTPTRRLCHMPPNSNPHIIKEDAYVTMPLWSPDGLWFVFAGADNARELICQQRIYAYNRETHALVTLTEKPENRVCAINDLRWIDDGGGLQLQYMVWTGSSGDYITKTITLNPDFSVALADADELIGVLERCTIRGTNPDYLQAYNQFVRDNFLDWMQARRRVSFDALKHGVGAFVQDHHPDNYLYNKLDIQLLATDGADYLIAYKALACDWVSPHGTPPQYQLEILDSTGNYQELGATAWSLHGALWLDDHFALVVNHPENNARQNSTHDDYYLWRVEKMDTDWQIVNINSEPIEMMFTTQLSVGDDDIVATISTGEMGGVYNLPCTFDANRVAIATPPDNIIREYQWGGSD